MVALHILGGAALAVLGTSSTPNTYGSLAIGKVGANPTSGTTLANIRLNGGSVGTGRGAEINAIADANWSDGSSHPTYLTFSTVASSSTSATERIRVHAGGNVDIKTGNLVIGTSGKGIDFSATGGPTNGSGTSELFDDYEEGTFAPQYSGDSGAGSYGYARQAGKYTKIGNTVYYSFYITTNVVNANASGNLIITGLPFTSGSNNEYYQGASIGYYASWNNTYPSHALCDVNNTRIYIYKNHANSNITHAVPTDVTNGTSLIVSGHYHVA